MSEVVELLPTIRHSSLGWYYQPSCSAVDISGGSELSVVVSIPYLKDSFGRVFPVGGRQLLHGRSTDRHEQRRTAVVRGHPPLFLL